MSYGQDYENPFKPELKGVLSEMEESIDKALAGVHDEDARAGIPVEIAAWTAHELWRDGKLDSLDQLEACLRQIGSKLYCLAVPASAYGANQIVVNPADWTERQFALVMANGEDEAARLRQQWELSPDENMNRLVLTGIRQQGAHRQPDNYSSREP